MTYCFLHSSPSYRYHDSESPTCGHFRPLHHSGTVELLKLQMITSGHVSLALLHQSSATSPIISLLIRYGHGSLNMPSFRYVTELPSISNYLRWHFIIRYWTLLIYNIIDWPFTSSNFRWRRFSAISSGASCRWFQEVQVCHIKILFTSWDIYTDCTYLPYSIIGSCHVEHSYL